MTLFEKLTRARPAARVCDRLALRRGGRHHAGTREEFGEDLEHAAFRLTKLAAGS
jgi:hypothetical protein